MSIRATHQRRRVTTVDESATSVVVSVGAIAVVAAVVWLLSTGTALLGTILVVVAILGGLGALAVVAVAVALTTGRMGANNRDGVDAERRYDQGHALPPRQHGLGLPVTSASDLRARELAALANRQAAELDGYRALVRDYGRKELGR